MGEHKWIFAEKLTKKIRWDYEGILSSCPMEVGSEWLHKSGIHTVEFPCLQRRAVAHLHEIEQQKTKTEEKTSSQANA